MNMTVSCTSICSYIASKCTFMTIYSVVGVSLVSNCAIQIRFVVVVIIIITITIIIAIIFAPEAQFVYRWFVKQPRNFFFVGRVKIFSPRLLVVVVATLVAEIAVSLQSVPLK